MTALLLALGLAAAASAGEAVLPPGAKLVLPDGGNVSAEWVIPPSAAARPGAEVSLFVDPDGDPWLLAGHRAAFIPGQDALLRADRPFQQLLWLGRGQQIVRSYSALGRFVPGSGVEYGLPQVQFVPLAEIPLSPWRFAGASGGAVLVSGYNPRKKLWQLARLDGKNLSLVYQSKAQIADSAVPLSASRDVRPAVASGRSVWSVGEGSPRLLFVHPRAAVRRLVYAEGALFYATDGGVGVLDGGKPLEFLQASGCQIAAAGDDLYILLGTLSRGLLRIKGASRLAVLPRPRG